MATALPAVLLNTVTINSGSGSNQIRSGKLITDATTAAAVQAAGGQLANPNDPLIAAAMLIATKMRSRAANEEAIDEVLLSAAANENAAEIQVLGQVAIGSSATTNVQPAPMGKAGTFNQGLTATPPVTAGAGESAVLQLKKNGTNVGTALTLSSSTPVGVPQTFPGSSGLAVAATDILSVTCTYTAGGSPQYTGANTTALVQGNAA